MRLEELNELGYDELKEALTKCCGSSKWVAEMIQSGPYSSEDELLRMAEKTWYYCFEDDWLEAFRHHPKIGDVSSLQEKFSNTEEWASEEQAGVASADTATIERLAAKNKEYEEKFGFIFIVCATGLGASEMLEMLERRLNNDYEHELQEAMGEQHKITILRLKKLLS